MDVIRSANRSWRSLVVASAAFGLMGLAPGARASYPPDGSKPNGPGAYRNPDDGICVIGVKTDGTMLVDWSIANARDCVAWTRSADGAVNLVGMTTQGSCTTGNGTAPNDGYKHAWSTSLCYDVANARGISRVDLDNTDSMCLSKGGTVLTTGKCVAFGWQYLNRKTDGTLPVTGTGIAPTPGPKNPVDGLGFCYTTVNLTAAAGDGTYTSAATCPSRHNSFSLTPAEWPACGSTPDGCQTQASYDAGLGFSFTSSQCRYTYGVKGKTTATVTRADGTTLASGSVVDLTTAAYDTMGECLGQGFSWDNWLPVTGTSIRTNASGGDHSGMPAGTAIVKLDALTNVEDGGGDFYSGTGAVCLKCHSDQSRSYAERNKPGFTLTRHKLAGDAVGKPFQPHFTAAGSDWGLQGVQCAMCHSTSKPAQDDLIQIQPAGVLPNSLCTGAAAPYSCCTGAGTGTCAGPVAGSPKSASGHNQTEYGTHLIDVCYTCHGTAATPVGTNPATVIPVAGGDFANTNKGLAPIVNQFLNSPHAKYTGSSSKVDVGDKTKYGSSFEGYVCRSPATQFRNNAAPGDSQPNCVAAGLTWYAPAGITPFCYYSQLSCEALPTGQWLASFDGAVYPWAAAAGGPNGLCVGIGIGSIITTVYRAGEAEKIHNLDTLANTMCTNAGNGSATSGASGFWVKDGETSTGVPSDTAQGNCMTCHDVHWALADTRPEAEPLRRECTTCHAHPAGEASVSNAPQIDLTRINHLSSTGTPLEHFATNPNEACETCHMPKSAAGNSRMHLWRINTGAAYTTMGAGQANLAADGAYANAAWVDIDHACGQCHNASRPNQAYPFFTTSQLALAARGMHPAVAGTNLPPVADGTCSFDANTWTMTLTDASTDDHNAIVRETVNWGDGSVVADDRTSPFGPFAHTYIGIGSYPITHKVIDDAGQMTVHTCLAGPTAFTISGTVTNDYPGHTGSLAGATITVTRVSNGVVAATVATDVNGAYAVTTLKPGAYNVFAVKIGYVFPPAAGTTVGPNQVVNINSGSPVLRAIRPPQLRTKPPSGIVTIPAVP
jgi:hypothetical protein